MQFEHIRPDSACLPCVGQAHIPYRIGLWLVHTATPDTTRLSCPCRVRFGGLKWIPATTQDCRRRKILSLNTFGATVQFTSPHQTRHRQDRLVVSGVHGGMNWALPFNQIVFSVQGNHATLRSVPAKFPCIPRDCRHSHIHPGLLVTDGVFDGNSPVSRRQHADHVLGYAHLPPRRWTTLYHGCTRSSATGRSHMRVLPPGTLCPTTSAPWLILSCSENCLNHTILVKLLTLVAFCVFLGVLAFG